MYGRYISGLGIVDIFKWKSNKNIHTAMRPFLSLTISRASQKTSNNDKCDGEMLPIDSEGLYNVTC